MLLSSASATLGMELGALARPHCASTGAAVCVSEFTMTSVVVLRLLDSRQHLRRVGLRRFYLAVVLKNELMSGVGLARRP